MTREQILNFKVSIVEGVKPSPVGVWKIRDVLNYIYKGVEGLAEFSEALAKDKRENVENGEAYSRAKKHLKGFLPAGVFAYRNDDKIKEYNPVFVYDIDGIEDPDYLEILRKRINGLPYIFANHNSPSRQGLKPWIIGTVAAPSQHKEHYERIGKRLSEDLQIPFTTVKELEAQHGKGHREIIIDKTCKNLSRFHYLNHDKNIFVNKQPIIL